MNIALGLPRRHIQKDIQDPAAATLRALADRMDPEVRRAFMRAVERIRGNIDVQEFGRLLLDGQVDAALQMVEDAMANGEAWRIYTDEIRVALIAGGDAAAFAARVPTVVDVRFDVINPETAQWVRTYEFDLIRDLTTEARSNVRTALAEGIMAGRNPLDTARDVRAVIGLTRRQEQAVSNFRRMLENRDATALRRALRDRRFDATIRRILRGDDVDPAKIDRMVERYREVSLKMRSETIGRTESIRAVQAGQHHLWQQLVASGVVAADEVICRWIYTPDGRTRDAHRGIPRMNPDGVTIDQPFASALGPIRYPGDPAALPQNTINCRCAVAVAYVPRIRRGV